MTKKDTVYAVISWALNCHEDACNVCAYAGDELGEDIPWCSRPADKDCVDGVVEYFMATKSTRFCRRLNDEEYKSAVNRYTLDMCKWEIRPQRTNALIAVLNDDDGEPIKERYFDLTDNGFRQAKEWCVSECAKHHYNL